MVTWTPEYSIADTNAGKADAAYKKMGAYWGSCKLPDGTPQRIMLRAFHEFEDPGHIYGIGANFAVPYTEFLKAWHRMVVTIHEAGGTNVGFCWCPTEGWVDRTKMAQYVPPAAEVDWMASDWYNTPPSQSTPLATGWATFDQMFFYDSLGSSLQSKASLAAAHGKPFFVAETSTLPGTAGQKGKWFSDTAASVAKRSIIGVSIYDRDVTGAGDHDYRVTVPTSDPTCLSGWVAMAKSPAFQGR
jgi:hypothetical protein